MSRKINLCKADPQLLSESVNTFYQFFIFADVKHGEEDEDDRYERRDIAEVKVAVLRGLCDGPFIIYIAEGIQQWQNAKPAKHDLETAKFE
jgi:hypothetical protein